MSGYLPVPNPGRGDRSEEVFEDQHSGNSVNEDGSQQQNEAEKRPKAWLSWPRIGRASAVERGWKPISMSAPILLSFAVFSLLLAACIEMLAQCSSAHGGLALSPSIQDIPRTAMMAHKYVPIVVATLYSMVWTWVDQDVKRMQPWFELSKPQGARGADSLFLGYPHDFFVVVLCKAAKKKHWSVFLSGIMMVTILFLLTPLQPSVMGVGPAVLREPINIVRTSKPGGSSDDYDFLAQAHNIKRYQQPFPLFTTPDYALLPFFAEQDAVQRSANANANVTARTIKFWTELTCWPPNFLYTGETGASRKDTKHLNAPIVVPAAPILENGFYKFGISDDGECIIALSSNISHQRPYGLYYIAELSNVRVWSPAPGTNKTHCSSPLLALVQTNLVPGNNTSELESRAGESNLEITARLCRRGYYRQEFMATTAVGDSRLYEGSLHPVSERLPLSQSEFDLAEFEIDIQMLKAYSSSFPDWAANALQKALEEPIEFVDIHQGAAELVWYLFAGQKVSVAELSDPEKLVHEFSRLRNLLFSLYAHGLLTNKIVPVKPSDDAAKTTFALTGIIVSRVFSALVEGLLVLNAIGCLLLLWLQQRSPCRLESNPNSISRLCRLCHNGPDTVQLFEGLDMADDKTLELALAEKRFRLSYSRSPLHSELYLERIVTGHDEDSTHERRHDAVEHSTKDPRPFEITRKAGIIFFFVLVGATVALTVVKRLEVGQGGLPRPTDNFEQLQILQKYLPSGFATALGAIWVLLNRQFCVLEPFRHLCAGKATPSTSIATTYSALPPQLTVWRAIKARHYILSMLCLTSLLAGLLGISLGTLFNENTTVVRYPQRFEPMTAPSFNNQSLFDFHHANKGRVPVHDTYLLYADMTSNTPLPPWASRDYFFQPQRLGEGTKAPQGATYVVATRGFGVEANCTPVYQLSAPRREESPVCRSAMDLLAGELQNTPPKDSETMRCSLELTIPSMLNDTGACGFDFVLGWVRANGSCPLTMVARSQIRGQELMRFTAMYCRPSLRTAMFDVTVDATGKVYSYSPKRANDGESGLNYPGFGLQTRVLLRYAMNFPGPEDANPQRGWHDTMSGGNSVSVLIAALKGSRDFLDSEKPPPNATGLIPAVEEIYRRGFAIFLGRHPDLFDAGRAGDAISGVRLATETRIFLDQTSLIISLIVMSINIVVAVVIYGRPSVRVLPRMPTCIASTMAYVAPSRIVAGSGEALGKHTLSFGRYVGLDGKPHTGIELDDHVTLIKSPPRNHIVERFSRKLSGLTRGRKPRRRTDQGSEEHQGSEEP